MRTCSGSSPATCRGVALVDRLELVAGPDLAAVGRQLDDRVERLHRRVREIREFVGRAELARGAGDRRVGVAVLARRHARFRGELAVFAHDLVGAALFVRFVPVDFQCVAALFRGPEAGRDDGDAIRHLHDGHDARHRLRGRRIERLDGRAEARRPLQQRDAHAGEGRVERSARCRSTSPTRRRAGCDGRSA
jgi:hypothetical protein